MIQLEHARPIARKEHRCEECGRTIEPGEQYHRQCNIADDGPITWKGCRQCAAFLNDLWTAGLHGEYETYYPYLSDVDWTEVVAWGPVWPHRIALWKRHWRRRGELVEYPQDGAV